MRAECPTGCGRVVAYGKLLCLQCWREVPLDVQREVSRTWRKYQDAHRRRQGLGGNDEIRAARLAYQDARDKAIGAVP